MRNRIIGWTGALLTGVLMWVVIIRIILGLLE